MTIQSSSPQAAGELAETHSRSHKMQFGTRLDADGFNFRIWAPGARDVALALSHSSGEKVIPMDKEDNGWFAATTQASTGDQYQFVIDQELRVPDPASRYQPDDVHGKPGRESRIIQLEGCGLARATMGLCSYL